MKEKVQSINWEKLTAEVVVGVDKYTIFYVDTFGITTVRQFYFLQTEEVDMVANVYERHGKEGLKELFEMRDKNLGKS